MLYRKVSTLVAVFVMLVGVSVTLAQDDASDDVLEPGETVTGEITNRQYEVEYRYEASAGDVLAAQLIPDDAYDGLSNPSVIMLNTQNQVVASVEASLNAATLFYDVPSDATYTIIATRAEGRTGSAQGTYALTVDTVPVLVPGDQVEATAANDAPQFYAIRPASAFDVTYRRQGGGEFTPSVSINVLAEEYISDTNLTSIASMKGGSLARGTIGVNPTDTLYIVEVGEALFDISISKKTVSFTLSISAPE